ncbi:hypothetical protein LPU83_pLPU83c_0398 (plasmid) [Rhizobium favelukesii]|uniref:Uncharacterized protein n=1 Tax=Rhizobium favelukesii TaxID=348824 RepID=W6RL32_9HYPH|nr:hypothetical protein LPU83_pLPU83c_0398 [Rhizobium favelukesii]
MRKGQRFHDRKTAVRRQVEWLLLSGAMGMRPGMAVNAQIAFVKFGNNFSPSLTGVYFEQLVDLCLESIVILFRGGGADIEKISKSHHLPHQL